MHMQSQSLLKDGRPSRKVSIHFQEGWFCGQCLEGASWFLFFTHARSDHLSPLLFMSALIIFSYERYNSLFCWTACVGAHTQQHENVYVHKNVKCEQMCALTADHQNCRVLAFRRRLGAVFGEEPVSTGFWLLSVCHTDWQISVACCYRIVQASQCKASVLWSENDCYKVGCLL